MPSLQSYLRQHKYHLTKPRQIIFDTLNAHDTLTMRQLLDAVGEKVDRVSAYRTVALFEKLAIVHRVSIGWKYKLELTEHFRQHHHHASCKSCGVILPIENCQIEQAIASIAALHHFTITSHHVELLGYCGNCSGTSV